MAPVKMCYSLDRQFGKNRRICGHEKKDTEMARETIALDTEHLMEIRDPRDGRDPHGKRCWKFTLYGPGQQQIIRRDAGTRFIPSFYSVTNHLLRVCPAAINSGMETFHNTLARMHTNYE